MKECRKKLSLDEVTVLGVLSQNVRQYDNQSLQIVADSTGTKYLVEYTGCDTRVYEYDSDEAVDISSALAEAAENCADSADYPYGVMIERIAWALSSPEEYSVPEDYSGDVAIVQIGNYVGFSPISMYVDDEMSTPIIFAKYSLAREYIARMEGSRYDLGHNEAGRPRYYIVAA